MWLTYNTVHILPHPPPSPDLNPIEHLWDELEQRVRKRKIRSKPQLKIALMEEWRNIGEETTKKLVHSMKRRLEAVIENNGLPTKY